MKLSINITIFPLPTSCPWEMREARKWKHRLPQQYLFKTSYPEDLSQTTSFAAYLLWNSAVTIFPPFILSSDKSLSFQCPFFCICCRNYVGPPFLPGTGSFSRRVLPGFQPLLIPYLSRHLNYSHCQSISAPAETAQTAIQSVLTTHFLNHKQHI